MTTGSGLCARSPTVRFFASLTIPSVVAEKQNHDLRGTLSFFSGSAADGYGSGSDMSTGFTLERSIFADSRLNFSGNVGYGVGLPAAALRATYSHRLVQWLGTDAGPDHAPLCRLRSQPAQRRLAGSGAFRQRRLLRRRCSGIQVWQRAADHPVPGTRDRLPPPRLCRSAPFARHRGRIQLRDFAPEPARRGRKRIRFRRPPTSANPIRASACSTTRPKSSARIIRK